MVGTGNVVLDKSFCFAIRIVNVYKFLVKEHKEHVLSKQLLRSGTSVGANANEAQAAQSKADFIAKMSIASKEARENGILDTPTHINRIPEQRTTSCTNPLRRKHRNLKTANQHSKNRTTKRKKMKLNTQNSPLNIDH